MNRTKVRGVVVDAHGVGGSIIFNVTYEEVWVNLLHKNILVNDITVSSY